MMGTSWLNKSGSTFYNLRRAFADLELWKLKKTSPSAVAKHRIIASIITWWCSSSCFNDLEKGFRCAANTVLIWLHSKVDTVPQCGASISYVSKGMRRMISGLKYSKHKMECVLKCLIFIWNKTIGWFTFI